ncbi:MAG: hypothetical protein GXY55_09450 [Phycisphaerae bacterium]|nr:hypothetical protein [Phycisphaerae bacterium]
MTNGPEVRADAAGGRNPASSAEDPLIITILFLEDSPRHLDAILMAIDRYEPSWSYERTSDGQSAHQWLTENRVRVIVMDVMLRTIPGASSLSEGAFLAAVIRGEQESPDELSGQLLPDNRIVPIVLFTARGGPSVRADAAAYGLKLVAVPEVGKGSAEFSQQACQGVVVVEKSSDLAEGEAFLNRVLRPLLAEGAQGTSDV